MYWYDSTMIILIPAILLSIYAQAKISSTYGKYSKITTRNQESGSQIARSILDKNGLYNVPIEIIQGKLTDNYNPSSKTLRLSEDVYYGRSIAAIGVAAHECGHAIQDSQDYVPLTLRNNFYPVANFGSNLSWIFIMLGFFTNVPFMLNIGIVLFSAAVLFEIITLPVEFNASKRAIAEVENGGILFGEEVNGAKRVLEAAALTYVAATLTAILQLVRLILISRDRDR